MSDISSTNCLDLAVSHLQDVLSLAIHHTDQQSALVIYDSVSPLSILLTKAYKRCLPNARFVDFNTVTADEILTMFKALKPNDLVVLIQSSSFRLNAFRLRVELFDLALKVIEHPHLERMQGMEMLYYIESLAYNPHTTA